MAVVIIGGGVAGLVAGYRLAKKGKKVIVVEKEKELGGLLSSIETNGATLERFYHHLFPFFREFIQLTTELGLDRKIEWVPASTAFYYGEKMYKLTSPLDLLFYKPLNLMDKVSLAGNLLRMRKIKDSAAYDDMTAKEFILKRTKRSIYDKVYRPLLRGKFGKNSEEISAAWFIERMNLRNRRGAKGEKLGYLRGGFKQFIDKLAKEITSRGGEIITGAEVKKMDVRNGKVKSVYVGKRKIDADAVISTVPVQPLSKIVKLPADYVKRYSMPFESPLCVIIGLDKKLFDYYWINILDEDIRFAAVIEHTNLMPAKDYGTNIIYLAGYPDEDSSIWGLSPEEVFKAYFKDLQKIAPVKLKDVKWRKVCSSRESVVVYKRGVMSKVRKMGNKTPIKNLVLCGAFNSYPEGSINESVKRGIECAELV